VLAVLGAAAAGGLLFVTYPVLFSKGYSGRSRL
jgi:hypothetical protein